MVILQVKRADQKNHFLYETKVTTPVSELLRDVAELHNMRIKVFGFLSDIDILFFIASSTAFVYCCYGYTQKLVR